MCPTRGSSSAYQNGSITFFTAFARFFAATEPAPAAEATLDLGIEAGPLELALCPPVVALRLVFGCCAALPPDALCPEVRLAELEAATLEAPFLRSSGASEEVRFSSLAGSDRERRTANDDAFSFAEARWLEDCPPASQCVAEELELEAAVASTGETTVPPRPVLLAVDNVPDAAETFLVTRAEDEEGIVPEELRGTPSTCAD